METTEAFEVLGIASSSTVQEIEARFRALAQEHHPDVGGSNEAMQRLNLARDVALAASVRHRALVPAEVVRDVVIATTTALAIRMEVSQSLQVISVRIRKSLTNRLRSFRQLSTLVGGVSAAAIFVGKDLPEKFIGSFGDPKMSGMLTFTALTFGMYCAVAYWYLTNRIERAELLAEELSSYLSVRSNYVALLDQITTGADNWTLQDFEHYVVEWAKSKPGSKSRWEPLIRDAGSEDFGQLLLAKGRDLDLLKRTEHTEGRLLIERFSLSLGSTST